MSIAGYLGKAAGELRVGEGEVTEGRVEGRVLEGKLSVEEAQAVVTAKAWKPGETYESVADYDPVLRSHCRLDREG
jgi:hypothetical protein